MSEDNTSKRQVSRNLIFIIVLVVIVFTNIASIFWGNYAASRGIYFTKVSNDVLKSSQLINDVEKYKNLFTVRDMLLKKYDGAIDDNILLEGAIKGMTSALGDPYTVYYNEKEFDKLMKESQGTIEGVGVQIASIDNKIVIISSIKDSPADKAGLQAGDIIEKIDNAVYSGEKMNEAVSYITSKDRDQVTFTIKRDSSEFEVKIKKEKIKIKSLEGQMINSNIGYIKIDTFMNENTAADFEDKINDLKGKGMKGLILDLRNNPGGLLSQAVGVASQFIEKNKVITYTVDKYENKNESLSVGGSGQGLPLIVLVNNGSASASEVVTGALRDYKAAVIVGKTTFGKGIVQQPIKIEGAGGLKVTISKYYTPNGENIHKKGIAPDYDVDITEDINVSSYSMDNDEQLKMAKEKMQEMIK